MLLYLGQNVVLHINYKGAVKPTSIIAIKAEKKIKLLKIKKCVCERERLPNPTGEDSMDW